MSIEKDCYGIAIPEQLSEVLCGVLARDLPQRYDEGSLPTDWTLAVAGSGLARPETRAALNRYAADFYLMKGWHRLLWRNTHTFERQDRQNTCGPAIWILPLSLGGRSKQTPGRVEAFSGVLHPPPSPERSVTTVKFPRKRVASPTRSRAA